MAKVEPIPEHLHTVTPRLVVHRGADALAFYVAAFEAKEIGDRVIGPQGELIHAEIRVGDSVVMITEGAPLVDGDATASASENYPVTAIMVTYWEDVDRVWDRAVAAGAQVIFPLADHFYGERGGRLRDPFGQQWMVSQRI